MISETKLNSSFPEAQFYMESYSKPYRLDRSSNGRGIMLYVRDKIPSKLIQPVCYKLDKEYFLVEINLRSNKWLLACNYNPLIKDYLACISKEIDSLSTKYNNILILGDFNYEPAEESMTNFCQIHGLKDLIN